MRVLIVEDDAVSRRVFQRAVERFGHQAEVAVDGADAWERFQREPFDVVLTDRIMPRLDGLDLCRRIRARPGPRYTYVIMLTVLSGHGHFLQGMQAGADDYLTKPLDPEELQARLVAAARLTALCRRLADTAAARGRLEGVTLAAREMVHLLTNDLSLAVTAVDVLLHRTDLTEGVDGLLRQADAGLSAADRHLRELQRVVRVRTKETPVGPSLDLASSIAGRG